MTREDIELYVMGQYDGDVAVLERAIADEPALAAVLADEARLEVALREAAAAATFCPACDDLVRGERCDSCGCALRPGGYTVERVLVSNAHGRMYVARDADGRRVALKELAFVQAPSPTAVAAFEREAKFLRALEHPAIPRFLASFEEGAGVHARYYLAQELVEGEALDRLDDHWYREAEIVEIARQVLAILVYLQSLSPMVIHRDIKPANLLKRKDGTIALVDFGAAHVHGTTAGSTTIGTFGYMPVEQLAGIVDATTDCYALGATLVCLMTRQEPWRIAQSRATINASSELRAVLDKLTAPDPRDRFATAKDALAALDKRHELVPRRRLPMRALAIAAVALAGGGGVFALVHSRQHAVTTGSPPAPISTLKFKMRPGLLGKLFVDNHEVAMVSDGMEIPVAPGMRTVRVQGNTGAKCEEPVKLEAGQTTTLECSLAPPASPRLDDNIRVSWSFDKVKLHDVLHTAAEACGVNIVVPDSLDSAVSINLKDVPCDQAIEALLESQSLWYAYDPAANLVRVAPRKELDREVEAASWREEHGITDDPLPAGSRIDLDLKNVPLHSALAMIATSGGGGINIVVPDSVDGKVTVRMKGVPWDHAMQAMLAAHGLWYRYRDSGRIVRVAPRKELDAEAEAGH
jgi:serine/threonine protein kinase